MTDTERLNHYASRPFAKWAAFTSICLTNYINSASHSAVGIAIPEIAKDLNAEAILVTWIPSAFLLTSAVALIPAGRLADLHGRKKIYLVGLFIFLLTSFFTYFAKNIEILIFFRLLQGIGSGMMFATAMAIIMGIFDEKSRGLALGIGASILYMGLASGPLLGGWLTADFGWRSVFLLPAILSIIAGFLIVVSIKGDWTGQNAVPVDWTGSVLFMCLISFFYIGVSLIPDISALPAIAAGVLFIFLFYYQQSRTETPLVNFRAIRENRVFSRSLLAGLCTYGSNVPLVFLMSLYLQFIKDLSPVEAGQIMLLQPLIMVFVAPIAGKLSDHFEPRIIATLGCLIMSAAFALLILVSRDTSLFVIAVSLLLLGAGFGLFTTPNNNGALSAVRRDRLGIASALLNLARTCGNILGNAVMLLLVALIIGNETINPGNYDGLLLVIKLSVGLSCLYTVCGAFFSYTRGTIRQPTG